MVAAKSSVTITVPPAQSIVVFTQDSADVYQIVGASRNLLGTVTAAQQTFGPFAGGATIVIDANNHSVFFSFGSSPVLPELLRSKIQLAPAAINGSSALTVANLFNGLINANAGLLGATGTLPTGSALDAAAGFRPDDAFDWTVMSTGLGTFNIGASAGHTIGGGSAGVGSGQSGAFRTRKTGTNTFVTYRIG
jgi:hypothetical protein